MQKFKPENVELNKMSNINRLLNARKEVFNCIQNIKIAIFHQTHVIRDKDRE